MKKTKFLVVAVICLLSVLVNSLAFAAETSPQIDYAKLLSLYGVEVSEEATIREVQLQDVNKENYDALEITEPDSRGEKVTVWFLYETDENGKDHYVSPSAPDNAKAASGGSRNGVTASAYYNTMSSGGRTLYRPYKLEVVSSGTKKFTISYQTAGGKFNLSGTNANVGGVHNITITKNPPVANQMYSTTSYASYYFDVVNGYFDPVHQIEFRVGTLSPAYYALPR